MEMVEDMHAASLRIRCPRQPNQSIGINIMTSLNFIAGLPLCQIVSGANNRVIRADSDLRCYVADSDPNDVSQLWQLVAFPDQSDSVVLITQVRGVFYCLRETSGDQYPQLTLWKNDSSSYWQLGGARAGISSLRTSEYCLTMQGAEEGKDPWQPGTRIQMWNWKGLRNQKWAVKSVA